MEYKIVGESFSYIEFNLKRGDKIRSESGAMIAMGPNIDIDAKLAGGGLFGALKSVMGGESLFQTTYSATDDNAYLSLAPKNIGHVVDIKLTDEAYILQGGSFLASETSLNLDTKFAGAAGFLGGEGLFWLRVTGTGIAFVSSFGAIVQKKLAPGEKFILDSGHMVAFSGGCKFNIKKATKGIVSSITSGEGLVIEFEGAGVVYYQTRHLGGFAASLAPYFRG